ncbi:MFS transporter [Legionella spiritensis]|uniref:MFS transporter n=1 Tax=Legionella spiritensis TaxID=452 RepID=UPI001E46F032|nr:MFS transporter [Legionella spiritensis]
MLDLSPKKPHRWITSLYFFQSVPYVVVSLIATLMYQQYGISNRYGVFLSSIMILPWAFKPVIAPLLESISTKKRLTVAAQIVSSLLFLTLAISINAPDFILISSIVLALIATTSSIHDIVSDGIYLLLLDEREQKRYVALRTLFYQSGQLFIKGVLLVLTAKFASSLGLNSWQLFYFSLFIISGLLVSYHCIKIPEIEHQSIRSKPGFSEIIRRIANTPKVFLPLLFIFLYNFSEAQMQKIIPLYLMDKNGPALNLAQTGVLYGVAGGLFMILGIHLSGLLLKRYTVRRCMMFFTSGLLAGHGLFLYDALAQTHYVFICLTITLNQFLVGMVNGGYMSYLLNTSNKCEYPMSLYSVCTSIMALSYVLFGSISGVIEQQLTYSGFFIYILIANGFTVVMTYWVMKHYE